MKKLLLTSSLILLSGCMTQSRWVNNPVADFDYHYEAVYDDQITQVVELVLNPGQQNIKTRQDDQAKVSNFTLASQTRIYNIDYGDHPFAAIYKHIGKMRYRTKIESQGSLPLAIPIGYDSEDKSTLFIQGTYQFIVKPEVQLTEQEIAELKAAQFEKNCPTATGDNTWCVSFWVNAIVFDREQETYRVIPKKTLPNALNITLYHQVATEKTNTANLAINTISTPILLAGDVILAPLGILVGAMAQ